MSESKYNLILTEKAVGDRVKECLALIKSRAKFKDIFWSDASYDEFGNAIVGTKNYLDRIESYLNQLKENNYSLEIGYSPGKHDSLDELRLYSKARMSQQGLISTVKNYITPNSYYDYDIVNCAPTLLLEYILKKKICCSTTFLTNYVEHRDTILSDNNITKMNIIKLLNSDITYGTGEPWLDNFNRELKNIKSKIIEHLNIVVPKGKNEISKIIGKQLKIEERIIVDELIEFIGVKNVAVTMFDGVNSYIECDIVGFSKMIREKHGYKHIELISKPIIKIDNIDIIVEADVEYDCYEVVKEQWQKEIFKTITPDAFWRTYDGETFQISRTEASDYSRRFQYSYYEGKKLKVRNIWEKWLEDKSIREYKTVDFIPFSTPTYENPPNSNVYNLAYPYKVHDFKSPKIVPIDNFMKLISNLSQYDDKKFEYLTKLLAFKMKHPEKKAEIIMMMIGHTGTGKSTLWEIMSSIMYDGAVAFVNDLQDIVGNSCSLKMTKSAIIISEEVDFANMKSCINKMKDVSTSTHITIKEKYEKPITITNTKLIVIDSQHDLYVENNCRRTVLYEPSADIKRELSSENEEYWSKLYKDKQDPNWLFSVFTYLMNQYDETYTPQKNRATVIDDAITDAKEYSLPAPIKFILDITGTDELMEYGEMARQEVESHTTKGSCKISVNKLREIWDIYYSLLGDRKPSFNTFPQTIRKYKKCIEQKKEKRRMVYIFNPKKLNEYIRTILNLN